MINKIFALPVNETISPVISRRQLDDLELIVIDHPQVKASVAVSYTHLDVYKRQAQGIIDGLRKVGGDTAKYALDNKLVDELATSTEVEKALTKQFGWSKADKNYRAISYYDYNVKTPSDQGSAIAVIFALSLIHI